MMSGIAAVALSENLAEGFDMTDPFMLMLAGVSLNYALAAAREAVVIVAEDDAPVSSVAPTVAPVRAA